MSDEMDEIISEFVTEAEETLDRIDPLFVELENRGYDKDMLNEIFRGMHTLKGAAGFLGFQQIVDVAHRAESIMKRLRDNGIAPSRGLMDIILTSVDMLRVLIGHVKVRDGAEENISELLARLDIAMEGPLDEEPSSPAPVAPKAEPAAAPVSAAAESIVDEVQTLPDMTSGGGPSLNIRSASRLSSQKRTFLLLRSLQPPMRWSSRRAKSERLQQPSVLMSPESTRLWIWPEKSFWCATVF